MRVLGIWLLILAAWFAVVAVAFGQEPRATLREELTPTDPLLESGWTREKDGSYVRTFRRPASPKATAPTPQARPEAQPRKLTTARSVPQRPFQLTGITTPTTIATGVALVNTSYPVSTATGRTITGVRGAGTHGDTSDCEA